MIRIIVQKEYNIYNVYHMIKAFYPLEEISQKVERKASHFVSLYFDEEAALIFEEVERQELDRLIYKALAKRTGKNPSWGVLLGIRPTKLVRNRIAAGEAVTDTKKWLMEEKLVSEEKAKLACDIAIREKAILQGLNIDKGYNLYVGIPFCPSICNYCSFSSGMYDVYADRVDAYIEALGRELKSVAENTSDKKLNTIYIGGGTPTSLNAHTLDILLCYIERQFDISGLLEYTVEAGRPDSISNEKLKVLRKHGITRISINPQSMQQKTLDRIGRRHTAEDVYSAFTKAREAGFDNINMDLILGLDGEDAGDVADTLSQVRQLAPDNLTVHTLAVKRAARLERVLTSPEVIEEMIEISRHMAKSMEMKPYYLYRQKNIAGNFENTGYSKVDKAGIYNILIMEELQSIIACGAGATTKIVLPGRQKINGKSSNIIRVDNVKGVDDYIDRIDEMIAKKEIFYGT